MTIPEQQEVSASIDATAAAAATVSLELGVNDANINTVESLKSKLQETANAEKQAEERIEEETEQVETSGSRRRSTRLSTGGVKRTTFKDESENEGELDSVYSSQFMTSPKKPATGTPGKRGRPKKIKVDETKAPETVASETKAPETTETVAAETVELTAPVDDFVVLEKPTEAENIELAQYTVNETSHEATETTQTLTEEPKADLTETIEAAETTLPVAAETDTSVATENTGC